MKRARNLFRAQHMNRVISYHHSIHEHQEYVFNYLTTVPLVPARYQDNYKREDFDNILYYALSRERAFVGFMPSETVREQEAIPRHELEGHWYFCYFSAGKPGKVTVSYTCLNDLGKKRTKRHTLEDFGNLQAFLDSLEIKPKPFDRGFCLMYAARVRNEAKVAIFQWSLCAQRLGLVKDLRVYIARLLWNSRCAWMP